MTSEECQSLASTFGEHPHLLEQKDIQRQPEHVAKVLKHFLKGDWENEAAAIGDEFLLDRVLLEFPVFALSDDYMRSLANIVFMKIDSARCMLDRKNKEVQAYVEERDKQKREQQLYLLKNRMGPASMS